MPVNINVTQQLFKLKHTLLASLLREHCKSCRAR